MLKHSAAKYLVWAKKKSMFLILSLAARKEKKKKRIWLKILFEGWYFKQDHSKYLRERSVEGGYLMKQHTPGPAHYLISLIGMKSSGLW